MFIRILLLTTIVLGCGSAAFAASGTPEEQAACRPDVRRFCAKLPKDAGDSDYLACLENNRDLLTKKCLAVLIDHRR